MCLFSSKSPSQPQTQPNLLIFKAKAHTQYFSGHVDLTHNLQVKLLSLLFLFFKNNSTNKIGDADRKKQELDKAKGDEARNKAMDKTVWNKKKKEWWVWSRTKKGGYLARKQYSIYAKKVKERRQLRRESLSLKKENKRKNESIMKGCCCLCNSNSSSNNNSFKWCFLKKTK